MRLTGLILAIATVVGSAASADPFTDQVISEFRELGFQSIDVKNGPTQVKVEGIRDNREYEVVYDRATGRILKQENGPARARDVGQTGVEVQERSRDFVGRSRSPSPVVSSRAAADPFTDRVIAEFREQGFNRIEVKNGPTQVKVEGIRGNREFEVVYDRATGRILKQEEGLKHFAFNLRHIPRP